MSASARQEQADLLIHSAGDFLAIKVNESGRLSRLVLKTAGGLDRVWLFADRRARQNEEGDWIVDHKMLGITCGTRDDGRYFVHLCRSLGLKVFHTNFNIPCARGQRRIIGQKIRGELSDYYESELVQIRTDLPSGNQLTTLLDRPVIRVRRVVRDEQPTESRGTSIIRRVSWTNTIPNNSGFSQ